MQIIPKRKLFHSKEECVLIYFPDISQSLVAMEPWLAKDPQHLTNVYSRMHALIQGTHG